MKVNIRQCDICKKEYRSDVERYWADCINPINLNFKDHAGLRCGWEIDVCTDCGGLIRDAIADKIKDLTPPTKAKEERV